MRQSVVQSVVQSTDFTRPGTVSESTQISSLFSLLPPSHLATDIGHFDIVFEKDVLKRRGLSAMK